METSSADDLPTVATIIGCPEQLTDTNGLVATPLTVQGGLGEGDEAIQKVILENFCTGFMSKKERDIIRCEICDVTCTGELAYKTHMAGKLHAKKLKEFEAGKKIVDDPFIYEDPYAKLYECTLCNVKLNAKNQIAAHVEGIKHKSRLSPNEKLYSAMPDRRPYEEDLSGSLLYCPACDVHANSTLQMEQHVTSAKHVNRINGGFPMNPDRRSFGPRPVPPGPPGRYMPYNQDINRDRDYDRYYDYHGESGPPYDDECWDSRARYRERYLSQERERSLVERAYHDSYHREPGYDAYDEYHGPPMGGNFFPPGRGRSILGGGRNILGGGGRPPMPPGRPGPPWLRY